jgi:type I restriction enzyme S subunit
MEVRKGYKQTEAGLIPDDWLEYTISDLIDFEGGSQPVKWMFSPTMKPGFIRLIQIRDYKTDKFITYAPKHLVRRFCTENDIMIGRYGPPIFQILRGIAGAYNVALLKAIPHSNLNQSYAYHFLKQEKLFAFVEKLSQRSSGQTGVDLKELKGYPLPLPPTLAEQEAIAEALSDADALIEAVEQLLTKKRQVKQGAMSELLTGKRRLGEFIKKAGYKQTDTGLIPEDWEVKPLFKLTKDIGDGIHATPEYVSSSDYYFINGNNLLDGRIIIAENTMCISEGEYRRLRKRLDSNTILMSINGTIGNLAYFHDEKVVLGKSAAYINVNQEIRKQFLYYTLQSHVTKAFYEDELTGTTIRNLSLGSIRNTPIPLPPTLAEQTAIAEILSDMDAEITALEEKLVKARQVKAGMMSELLTGKIRLV